MGGIEGDDDFHVILNMEQEELAFELPAVPGRVWHRFVDTGLAAPEEILEESAMVPVPSGRYLASGRSVVVLVSR